MVDIDIDTIKDNVKDYMNDKDIKNIYDILGKCDSSKEYCITSINQPIYYMFDHAINTEFGSNGEKMQEFRDFFKLDDLFSIKNDNLMFIGISSHATYFYGFFVNDRYYVYYSNTGFGYENQLNNVKEYVTACRILYMEEIKKDTKINDIGVITNCKIIVEKIDEIVKSDYSYKQEWIKNDVEKFLMEKTNNYILKDFF